MTIVRVQPRMVLVGRPRLGLPRCRADRLAKGVDAALGPCASGGRGGSLKTRVIGRIVIGEGWRLVADLVRHRCTRGSEARSVN